jgi:hypothetical protein
MIGRRRAIRMLGRVSMFFYIFDEWLILCFWDFDIGSMVYFDFRTLFSWRLLHHYIYLRAALDSLFLLVCSFGEDGSLLFFGLGEKVLLVLTRSELVDYRLVKFYYFLAFSLLRLMGRIDYRLNALNLLEIMLFSLWFAEFCFVFLDYFGRSFLIYIVIVLEFGLILLLVNGWTVVDRGYFYEFLSLSELLFPLGRGPFIT